MRRPTVVAAVGGLTVALIGLTTPAAHADPLDQWWAEPWDLATHHRTTQGEGVKVCVVDAAVDPTVPDLDGADLTVKGNGPAPGRLYAGHGTSMVAMIAGQGTGTGSGGAGILGVAPKAEVVLYAADDDLSTPDTDDDSTSIDEYVGQAASDGCSIISVSYSNLHMSESTFDEVDAADAILLLAGDPDAMSNNFVGVQAATREGAPQESERTFNAATVLAPGEDIVCGGMSGTADQASWSSDTVQQGSSCATAMTAGALALVRSAFPDATNHQVVQGLIHSYAGAEKWGYSGLNGWGPVSLNEMMKRDPSGWPDENPLVLRSQEVYERFPESAWVDPATRTDDTASDDEPAAAAATSSSDDGAPWGWIGFAAGIVVLAAIAVLLLRRRSPEPSLSTPHREA